MMTVLVAAYMVFVPMVCGPAPALPPHDWGQDMITTANGVYFYGVDFHVAGDDFTVIIHNLPMLEDIATAPRLVYHDGHYQGEGLYIRDYTAPAPMGLVPNPILTGRRLEFVIGGQRIVFYQCKLNEPPLP